MALQHDISAERIYHISISEHECITKNNGDGTLMKNLLLLLGLFIYQTQAAASPLPKDAEIFCQTELPTTSMHLSQTEDGKFRLQVTHHNGEKYAPIHNGIITFNDIGHLELKGKLVQQIGSEYTIDFEAKNCSIVDPEINEVTCYKRTPTKLGDLTVKSLSFHNYQKVSKLFGQEFKTLVMNVGMTYQNRGMSIDMDYNPGDCWFQI